MCEGEKAERLELSYLIWLSERSEIKYKYQDGAPKFDATRREKTCIDVVEEPAAKAGHRLERPVGGRPRAKDVARRAGAPPFF